jgi:hypothetical protein
MAASTLGTPPLALPGAMPQTAPSEGDATTDALVARAITADLRRDKNDLRQGRGWPALEREGVAHAATQPLLASPATAEWTNPRPRIAHRHLKRGATGLRAASSSELMWRWLGTAECLAGAGISLALATVVAGAQQQATTAIGRLLHGRHARRDCRGLNFAQ